MNTCFQDPKGFIKSSISPEFVPLLMDKDLLHKICASLHGIKQELYAKNLPTLKTHAVNLKREAKDLSSDLQRLEVRGKLGSKTLSNENKRASGELPPANLKPQIWADGPQFVVCSKMIKPRS